MTKKHDVPNAALTYTNKSLALNSILTATSSKSQANVIILYKRNIKQSKISAFNFI